MSTVIEHDRGVGGFHLQPLLHPCISHSQFGAQQFHLQRHQQQQRLCPRNGQALQHQCLSVRWVLLWRGFWASRDWCRLYGKSVRAQDFFPQFFLKKITITLFSSIIFLKIKLSLHFFHLFFFEIYHHIFFVDYFLLSKIIITLYIDFSHH